MRCLGRLKLVMKPILERKFEVKGKMEKKYERRSNNLIIIRFPDIYNILFISLYNYLSRNITKLLIETNLL